MPPLADKVVDWAALGQVVVTSLAAGVGITAMFALAILGATRAVDVRRDGHAAAALAYGALMAVAFAVVVAAVVAGIVVMTQK
jgi:hypothetical protein